MVLGPGLVRIARRGLINFLVCYVLIDKLTGLQTVRATAVALLAWDKSPTCTLMTLAPHLVTIGADFSATVRRRSIQGVVDSARAGRYGTATKTVQPRRPMVVGRLQMDKRIDG